MSAASFLFLLGERKNENDYLYPPRNIRAIALLAVVAFSIGACKPSNGIRIFHRQSHNPNSRIKEIDINLAPGTSCGLPASELFRSGCIQTTLHFDGEPSNSMDLGGTVDPQLIRSDLDLVRMHIGVQNGYVVHRGGTLSLIKITSPSAAGNFAYHWVGNDVVFDNPSIVAQWLSEHVHDRTSLDLKLADGEVIATNPDMPTTVTVSVAYDGLVLSAASDARVFSLGRLIP